MSLFKDWFSSLSLELPQRQFKIIKTDQKYTFLIFLSYVSNFVDNLTTSLAMFSECRQKREKCCSDIHFFHNRLAKKQLFFRFKSQDKMLHCRLFLQRRRQTTKKRFQILSPPKKTAPYSNTDLTQMCRSYFLINFEP